jgi:hypothetical protein
MSICQSQDKFNKAVDVALDTYQDKRMKSGKMSAVMIILMIVFTVWALILASRVKAQAPRVIHMLVALLLSPLYVLSYYLALLLKSSQ